MLCNVIVQREFAANTATFDDMLETLFFSSEEDIWVKDWEEIILVKDWEEMLQAKAAHLML